MYSIRRAKGKHDYKAETALGSGEARNLQLGMPHVKKFQSKYTI